MKRVLKYLLLIYLAVNVGLAVIFWPRLDQFLRFMPRVTPASYAIPKDASEANWQDITYLETLLDYDRSFSADARKTFKDRIDEVKSQTGKMTEAQFYLAVRALVAIADNAHTSAESSPAFRDFNRSGLDIYPFKDGYFIVRAYKDNAGLLGEKATHIDSQPIADIIARLRVYTGGPDNWRDMQSVNILRSPELLHAAGLIRNPDRMTLTVVAEDGRAKDVELVALPKAETANYYRHPFMMLLPEALEDEGEDWVRTLNSPRDSVAAYLANASDIVTTKPVGAGLYVRSNYLMGSKENPLKPRLQAPLNQAPDSGYAFIVVDLRWNPGGDYGNAVPFVRQVKSALKEDGKIYVITGGNTFSAAIVFSALLKQEAPDQTTIIGETMGDRPQFWAERGKPFVLPNSKYWIGYSTGFHDWEAGCSKSHTYCFPPNKKFEKDIGDLSVDVEIAPTYTDYASGRDVVMDWVMRQEN